MTESAPSPSKIVSSVAGLRGQVRERVGEIESGCAVPDDLIESLHSIGAFRLLAAADRGGFGGSITDMINMVATLAEADGSTAWVIGQAAMMNGLMSRSLDANESAERFADPHLNFAFSTHPSGQATKVDGGWSVSGRWAWGTGSPHATWFAGTTLVDDGRAAIWPIVPRSDVTIHPTWDPVGMRGTGSNDFTFDNLFVPDQRVTTVPFVCRTTDTFARAYKGRSFPSVIPAAVLVGMARRACGEALELADKKPYLAAETLRTSTAFQAELARCHAAIRAAAGFLIEASQQVWDAAADDAMTLAHRTEVRMAATHASATSSEVINALFDLAGGSGLQAGHPLARCLRDSKVMAQQVMVQARTFEMLGRVLLGDGADDAAL